MDVELAPLRPLDDFLLGTARFQVPEVQNLDRWSNRVLNNLLYYQTNYLLTTLLTFVLVGLLHPIEMVIGIVAVVSAFGMFSYITNNQYKYKKFKQNHPAICLGMILLSGYVMVYIAGAVLVFMFGIALPILLTLIHASLRLRNIKNKLSAKIEYVGLKRTPMGLILESLGQEQEAGS